MLNDPEVDKMIIYGLLGVCAVLMLAVIFLAVKKNTYYVNDEGTEVAPPRKAPKISLFDSKKKPAKKEPAESEPVSQPEPVYEPEPEPVSVSAFPAEPEEEPVLSVEAEEPGEEPVEEPVLPIFAPHDILDVQPAEEADDLTTIISREEEEEPEASVSAQLPVFTEEPAEEAEDEEDEEPAVRMISIDEEEEDDPFVNQVPIMSIPKATGLTVTITVAGQTETHEIDELPCLIGREQASCNLVISEPAVSRRHARIYVNEDGLFIEDVSEHNGTYINGTKLPSLGSAPLRENDRISLGRAEITVNRIIY